MPLKVISSDIERATYIIERGYGLANTEQDLAAGQQISRIVIAHEFGWTLDYVDELSLPDYEAVQGWMSGKNMANEANHG